VGTIFPFYESRTPSGIFGRFLSLVEKRRNTQGKAGQISNPGEQTVCSDLSDLQSEDKNSLSGDKNAQFEEKLSEKAPENRADPSPVSHSEPESIPISESDPDSETSDHSESGIEIQDIVNVRDIAKKIQDNTIETPGEREEFQYLWRRLTRHQRHSLSVFLESLEY
ncbi:MAG: hypothetical protein Q4G69_07790, partial [Planctomycetia bacterium]|nr:hypothetical protein [Planctomycetia bacterium]